MTVTESVSPLVPRRNRSAVREQLAQRTRSFTELAQTVRSRGLNNRTPGFYLTVAAALIVALGGAFTGLVLLRDSWFLLLIAAAFGIIFTQFAFLGHEASHRQVLTSGPANDRLGRVLSTLLVGISYAWWMNKHTRHHGNPNRIGKDPDIDSSIVSFSPEDALASTGLRRWITRRQGWLFFALLLFLGLELHLSSIIGLFARRRIEGRGAEIAMLAGRFAVYLGLLFWLVPVGLAFAFLGVQFAVFGLYMGITFSPNHIGMPLVPKDKRLDFLDKQVLTSRNVSGGWWMTVLMGGLNYQIEHHLFPSMPRPHLSTARTLVRQHCDEHGVPYAENSLHDALAIVVRHMNEVGLAAASRSFGCPTAGALGR